MLGFYDESCLLENPYFYVAEMECWPCQRVYSVIELTKSSNFSLYHPGVPFIIKVLHNKMQIFSAKLNFLDRPKTGNNNRHSNYVQST